MRKLLLVLVVALLAGAAAHQFLAAQHGFLLLTVGNHVIETTLWGAFLFALLLLALAFLLWRTLALFAYPRRWWQIRRARRQVRVRNQTVQGMLDYLEGNWPRAVDNLEKSLGQSQTPALNYLGAAAASFNLGDHAHAQELLQKAEEEGVSDNITAGLLRARMLLQENRFDRALTLLQSLHRQAPAHPTVLRLLATSRKGLRDWQGLEAMLPDLKKHKAVSSAELVALEIEVYTAIIDAFAFTRQTHNAITEQQRELDQLWDRLPRRIQKHPRLVAAYVRQLRRLGMDSKAEARLRRFIDRNWDEELVRLYGDLNADASAQLKTAENWLGEHPNSHGLLHTLGRLCVRNQLWGKGKEYFEAAIRLHPTAQLWFELGELLQILQDPRGSNECFRKGLREAVESLVEEDVHALPATHP